MSSSGIEQNPESKTGNLLTAIVDYSDDAIMSKDLDGIITSWNKSAERLFGFTASEAIGKHINLIIPEDRHEEEKRILARIGEGERVDHFDTVRRRKDGSLVDVSLKMSPVRDSSGQVVGASKVARDITDRKRAERDRGLLAAIVDSSDDAIISKNLDGIITSWNNSAERIFGYRADETIGKHITLIIPRDRWAEEAQIIERLRAGERVDHFQTIRVRKDGTFVDLSLTISPVRDSSGKVIGASKVARDVSAQIRASEALQESQERLRRLSESLESEIRARTHELEELSWHLFQVQDEERRHVARELHDSAGQTLTVLDLDLAELLRKIVKTSPELIADAERIQETVQQLYQEIRTTSYLLHPPLLDESGLASALNWYIDGLSDRSNLVITLEVSRTLGRLPRDMELAIFRLVQECLTNIHRHSGSRTASIRITRESNRVSVEVSDKGKGISPQRLTQIQSHGSGLGLRGMRERLRQFGGTLSIESPGQGLRIFTSLTIPNSLETIGSDDRFNSRIA